jgi:hypothetical protein
MADGSLRLMQDAMRDPSFAVTRTWNIPDVPALPGEDWGSYLCRIGFNEAQIEYVRRGFSNAAGEGTTSGTSVGTVHGVYRSGKRAAAEILANNHQK